MTRTGHDLTTLDLTTPGRLIDALKPPHNIHEIGMVHVPQASPTVATRLEEAGGRGNTAEIFVHNTPDNNRLLIRHHPLCHSR